MSSAPAAPNPSDSSTELPAYKECCKTCDEAIESAQALRTKLGESRKLKVPLPEAKNGKD